MIFRQFTNDGYKQYKYWFVKNTRDYPGRSQARGTTDLFGWGNESHIRQFCSPFVLELIYD